MVITVPLCGAVCGLRHSAAVTSVGEVWCWGTLPGGGESLAPMRVGGAELFGSRAVAVAAGTSHAAAVAEDGSVWTWGDGACGQLGHGDMLPRTVPTRIGALRAKIVLVSLGHWHSLAASVDGELLSWGYGSYGQLGLGDRENRNVPTFVANLRGHPITWVCAGELHSTAVSVHGDAWTFGRGENGRLGHNDENDKLDPQRLDTASFQGAAVLQTAAGSEHSVAVCADGTLWAWGNAAEGRLGLGKAVRDDVLVPTRVGDDDTFGGHSVVWASCGGKHTLAVCDDGCLFSFGRGAGGRLGHGDRNKRFEPQRVRPAHLSKVIAASAGDAHCVAVTEEGRLFSWGRGAIELNGTERPSGLGHGDIDYILSPRMLQLPTRVRTTRQVVLTRADALALAMSTHARLGSQSPCSGLLLELVERVVEAAGGVLGF